MSLLAAASWMQESADGFYDVLMHGCPIKAALGTTDHGGPKLKEGVMVWRQYLQPGRNQNPLAQEFKDGLAKLATRLWSQVILILWFRDNDDLER